ncbi:hypothetical protein [Brevibacillus daliensis]|uniref:hypothetical protein n=1 Tax=Brevibacillus daliensis TaxID=2892995 RepID=UPI001E5B4B50|nr:hypothetical protein [Brevibacillus daliensis]
MNIREEQVEEMLRHHKSLIVVDEEFQKKLRQSFESGHAAINKKRKSSWLKKFALPAISIAATIALIVSSVVMQPPTHVDAASLTITNQLSFLNVSMGDTAGIAEHDNKLYVSVKDKGIYVYDQKGFKLITSEEADTLRLNENGDKILFSSHGTILMHDLTTGKTTKLLKSDSPSVAYTQPDWVDDQTILLSESQSGEQSNLYLYNLQTKQKIHQGTGNSPSFVKDMNAIVYEHQNQLYTKTLSNEEESLIDQGHSPQVSPSGYYVTYLKEEPNGAENVWIADLQRGTTKQITTNPMQAKTKEENTQLKTEPVFQYSHPVWNTNSDSIYVIKQRMQDSPEFKQVMRIDVTTIKMTAEDTVTRYLQALITRDDDFAKSLLVSPPDDILTYSNPHPVGFQITGQGRENGTYYVDAELYLADTARPYYQVTSSRYWLLPDKNGYKIEKIMEQDQWIATAFTEDGDIGESVILQQKQTSEKKELFSMKDINQEWLGDGKYRFASLAYQPNADKMYLSLQRIDETTNTSVLLLTYDISTDSFALVDHVTEVNGSTNPVVSSLTVEPDGKALAVDFTLEDPSGPSTVVYELSNQKRVKLHSQLTDTQVSRMYSFYWERGKLFYHVQSNGQTIMFHYEVK